MGDTHHHPAEDGRIRVMVVDDDLLVRTTLARLLPPHRDLHLLGTFEGGRQALAAMSKTRLDVAVVDISMPGMSGPEVTRLAVGAHPHLRVLAYTSLADQQSLSSMLNAGAAGVVYKEASVSAVADAIRATHAGLSVLSPRYSRRLALPEIDDELTDGDIDILRLVGRGLSNDQIAHEVHLSASGVKYHISRLSEKLGAHNRVTLAVAAAHLGLLGRSAGEERSQ